MDGSAQRPTDSPRRPFGRRPVGSAARLTILAGVLCALGFGACRRGVTPPPSYGPLRLAIPLQTSAALAILAADRDCFRAEGLEVRFTRYVSGKEALEALRRGDEDAATSSEVPVVFQSFSDPPFRIIAGLAHLSGTHAIVARRDRGLATPADLRGKRIGTQRGSAVHFFLYVFLLRHGLTAGDVTTVFMKPEELPRALADGAIDAFSTREPFITQAMKAPGADVCVFEEDTVYVRTEVLTVATAILDHRPAVGPALLRALLRAEAFAAAEPARAIATVARALNMDPARVAAEWPKMSLRVGLDQSLLRSLEEEARWAMDNGLVTADFVPNFLEIVAMNSLIQVKPEALSIIR